MELLTENLSNILLALGVIYPPLVYLLPSRYALKLDLGIKIFKTIADALEKAKNTKSGFSSKIDDSLVLSKKYTQKKRS